MVQKWYHPSRWTMGTLFLLFLLFGLGPVILRVLAGLVTGRSFAPGGRLEGSWLDTGDDEVWRTPGINWGRVLSRRGRETLQNYLPVTCEKCGAHNVASEVVCWNCRNPLHTTLPASTPSPLGGQTGQTQVSRQTVSIRQINANGRAQIQVTDSTGRTHTFDSWASAPRHVMDEIQALPPDVRGGIERMMGRPIPKNITPPQKPPAQTPSAPAPATAEPQPLQAHTVQKAAGPPKPRGTWLEF